ncbi:hypothetical protein Pfo_030385 [Paulownia fortunei]|nr:hypothetical protein Pfo_030385 [Paulownia fortunei]
MAHSGALKLASLLIICLVVTAPHVEAGISCGTVLSSLSSCIGYLRRGGAVPPSCCDGAKSLNNAASTTPDLQAACRCIKSIVPSIGANPSLVNSLPGKCGVNIPYKYSPSLDCSKVTR